MYIHVHVRTMYMYMYVNVCHSSVPTTRAAHAPLHIHTHLPYTCMPIRIFVSKCMYNVYYAFNVMCIDVYMHVAMADMKQTMIE